MACTFCFPDANHVIFSREFVLMHVQKVTFQVNCSLGYYHVICIRKRKCTRVKGLYCGEKGALKVNYYPQEPQ